LLKEEITSDHSFSEYAAKLEMFIQIGLSTRSLLFGSS
jgi:hypothetical protein